MVDTKFYMPIVVVSKCLEFEACRWNSIVISDLFIRRLQDHVIFKPICPEFEIGLGIPRDPIRIVAKGTNHHLIQPSSGRDLTSEMNDFSTRYLDTLGPADGFILKGRSPSCGIKDVKIHAGAKNAPVIGKGIGFFAQSVLEKHPYLAIEDEGRLTNFRIREHFLTRLFALSALRYLHKKISAGSLVRFHSKYKLLLMAYSRKEMKILGRLVANHQKAGLEKIAAEYDHHFKQALKAIPRFTSHINVLMHTMGYFSKQLSGKEKSHFLKLLDKYRIGKIPLSNPLSIIRSWIIRFDEQYLSDQVYFEPYPEDLSDFTDSGKAIA